MNPIRKPVCSCEYFNVNAMPLSFCFSFFLDASYRYIFISFIQSVSSLIHIYLYHLKYIHEKMIIRSLEATGCFNNRDFSSQKLTREEYIRNETMNILQLQTIVQKVKVCHLKHDKIDQNNLLIPSVLIYNQHPQLVPKIHASQTRFPIKGAVSRY